MRIQPRGLELTLPGSRPAEEGREAPWGPSPVADTNTAAVRASQEGLPLGAGRDRKAHIFSQPGPPGSSQVAQAVRPGHWSCPQLRPALPGRGPVSSLTFLLLICIGSPGSAFPSWEGGNSLPGIAGSQRLSDPRWGAGTLGCPREEGGWEGHSFAGPRRAPHSQGPGFCSWAWRQLAGELSTY